MSKLMISLLAAAGIAFAGAAHAADNKTMSHDAYKSDKDKIEAQYKVDKDHCSGMSGNAKDICQKEAKGKEKVAKAELEANYKNTDKSRSDVVKAKADADYDVAKEKCDDLSGNQKDVCVKEAKAAHTKMMGDAKVMKVSEKTAEKRADAKKDAREDTRDAQYKVAVEKCDAMSGAAKDQCVKQAKVQFGKT
jgi:hypothetical protein